MALTKTRGYSLYNTVAANIDAHYGPWESVEAYMEWLSGTAGVDSPMDGTTIAVKGSDGSIVKYVWENDAFRKDVVVDGSLDETSENPLQNKVVKEELDKKLESDDIECKVDKEEGKGLSSNDYDDAAVIEVSKVGDKLDKVVAAGTYATKDEYTEQIESLTGLEGSNFMGIYDTLDEAKAAYGSAVGWALVGELDSLYAYRVDSSESATKIGLKGYDFTDFDSVKSQLSDLKSLVYNSGIGGNKDTTEGDFVVSDVYGNSLVVFKDGHVKVKKFDSSKDASVSERGLMSKDDKVKLNGIEAFADKSGSYTGETSDAALDISDEDGNVALRLKNGEVQTKNFDSGAVPKQGDSSDADFQISDENGKAVVSFENGGLKTKNFSSAIAMDKIATLEGKAKSISVRDKGDNVYCLVIS